MFSRSFDRRWLGLGALVASVACARVSQAKTRVGYFDVKRILAEVHDAKVAKGRLEADFKAKQKQLDEQKAQIDQLEEKYKETAPVMSDDAKQQAQEEIAEKMAAAQKLYMSLQQQLSDREQKVLADLITKLQPVVKEVAQQDGYTLVFEKNEAGLFYAPPADDLTNELIRRYNLRYNGGKKAAHPRHGKRP